jgi:uncharacterized protein YecE (DUF72 family)
MVKLSVGTAGFYYKDWIGPFYPKKLGKTSYLTHFSKFFNLVEINSTFYNLPSKEIIINWKNNVSNHFRFIVKVWKEITHKLDNSDLDLLIANFFSRLKYLEPKILGFLMQFPPWFKYSESHFLKLKLLLNEIPSEYKYIIELRDDSWFNPEIVSKFIDGNNIILGTTYMPGIIPFYNKYQNYYYIRLIGDRKLTVFNKIQRKQAESLDDLFTHIQDLMNNPNIYEIFIIVNNHFQGYAPESSNMIKKKLGLPLRNLNNQKMLSDFI